MHEPWAAPRTIPANGGVGLIGVYVAWISVVVVLYPACSWFARLKRRRRDWWLIAAFVANCVWLPLFTWLLWWSR